MSYTLKRFTVGTTAVELPVLDPETPVGGGPSQGGAVGLVGGGMFDAQGTSRAPLKLPYDLPLRAVVVEDTLAVLDATLRTLRGLRGQRGYLWRVMGDAGRELQHCWARVLEVPPVTRNGGQVSTQEVEVVFEIMSPWYGAYYDAADWFLNDAKYFNDGLYLNALGTLTTIVSAAPFTITHSGDAEITAIVITVTAAAGAAITALTVKTAVGTSVWEWTYTGTIAAGKALIVDCAAQTVKNDGTADYAHFDLTANHNQSHWFAFQPGTNTVTVTMTGGGATSTIAFAYAETWE
jgi:hypothetical protein